MADAFVAELPTNRQSRYYHDPAPNIHDPNYIPVLNGVHSRVDFSKSSFSGIPSIPIPHKTESQTSLKRTNSASAPETVVLSRAAHSIPSRSAIASTLGPQEIGSSHQPDRSESTRLSTSHLDHDPSSSNASTTEPGPEEHIFAISGNLGSKTQETHFHAVSASVRSSVSSVRKPNVPTSRYSKKGPNASKATQRSQPSPHSRGASSDFALQQTLETSRSTPLPATPVDLSSVTTAAPTTHLHVAKSTASERRSRPLHSHPSNVSLKSTRNSAMEEIDELPLMSHTFQIESRSPSVRSGKQSLYTSAQPTPPPSGPLPDLPVGARRPPTRERPIESGFSRSNSPARSTIPPSQSQNDHLELAEFMTTQKTTVFRRFDDIHIRLLLQLQDEVSSLEESLREIEAAGSGRPDQGNKKASILRDLRKVLAEYDHLFANWTSMQANKATPEARRELEKWLRSPGLESGKVSKTAMDDLHWLQKSKDLSSVSIDPEKQHHTVESSESFSKGSTLEAGGGGNGGAFLALFGCASKRK